MEFLDVLESDEIIEPETIHQVFPDLSTLDIQKLQVLWLLKHTRAAYEDMDVFEKVVLILNGIEPDVSKMEGSTPEYIWRAINIIKRIHPDVELADEVREYIRYTFDDNGFDFYPPGIGLNSVAGSTSGRYTQVKRLAETGPFPLKEDRMGIQAMRYLQIMHYLDKEGE